MRQRYRPWQHRPVRDSRPGRSLEFRRDVARTGIRTVPSLERAHQAAVREDTVSRADQPGVGTLQRRTHPGDWEGLVLHARTDLRFESEAHRLTVWFLVQQSVKSR